MHKHRNGPRPGKKSSTVWKPAAAKEKTTQQQRTKNDSKKYQDIVNFYFESPAFKELWAELLSVTLKWVGLGIQIFRVDNPHTKPYYFWNWLIAEVKKKHPDVLFLAEAFSRPKVMQQLAQTIITLIL